MNPPILTLTSDFGRDGPYVAAMKGVILGLVPNAQIVDVSHAVAPQNVLEGAFVLAGIVEAFPPGTVHLAVIDPGVGTERRLIAVSVAGQWFVAPDNGLLGGVVRGREVTEMWEIRNPDLWRAKVSTTFHGRDILAPAAAHLALGVDPESLGPRVASILPLMNFESRSDGRGLVGEVIYRDAFGNLITNVSAASLRGEGGEAWAIEIAGQTVQGIARTYGERPSGTLVAVAGSSGWIEIAVVNGDAGRTLTAGPGTTVWFRKTLPDPSPHRAGRRLVFA